MARGQRSRSRWLKFRIPPVLPVLSPLFPWGGEGFSLIW